MKKSVLMPLIVGFALGFLFAWFLQMNDADPQAQTNEQQEQVAQQDSETDSGENKNETDNNSEEDLEPPSDAEIVYNLDSEASSLGWSAYRLTGNGHTGTIDIEDGYMAYEEDGLLQGEFVVDMTSITESENNERFLQHIRSDDFFTVDTYPTAMLVVTGLESDGENTQVTGELTIRGITHEITFPATITRDDEQMTASAQFDIDRTRWGIVYDSGSIFKQLGDRAIEDDITYDLDLVLEAVQ